MTTYFAWVNESEIYDSTVHSRCDIDILELTIDHREGEVALATVTIAHTTLPPWNKRHVFISHGHTLLFSGRLVGLPVTLENELLSLELTSEPINASQQLKSIEAQLKQHPYWNENYVDPHERNNPAEWLEARSALIAWDRTGKTVCLSDLFQGRHTIDVTNIFFADSLKVHLAETPVSQISVNVTAEWIQKAQGEINISGPIASAFTGGMMNTLTPQALKANWFYEGQVLGKTGYWVVKSDLKSAIPSQTGILNLYPTISPEFTTSNETTQGPKVVRARRHWMSANLILGWRYHQKRRETVRFTLKQKTQLDGKIRPLRRELNIQLQQVDIIGGTFFLTHQGRLAVEHALEKARAHLAASVRCLEIELMMPFETGFTLSMDHSVRLVDSRLLGGEVMGKVIAYRLHQDGLKSFSWIRFAASIGGKPTDTPALEYAFYADLGYGDTRMPKHYQTTSGISYANYEHQRPMDGIVEAESLSVQDILSEVLVSYDASRQIQKLQNYQYPIQVNLQSILEEIPTVVSLNLKSLKTTSVAFHTIDLQILNDWVSPRQVNLRGENI